MTRATAPGRHGAARRNGFVLVNALILVAALAAAASYLLARSEGTRARLAATQEADQLAAYLDAYDALAQAMLRADLSEGPVDHPKEPWARTGPELPLDRGSVKGGIQDMQARFNLTWLSNPVDVAAQDAFVALTTRLSIPASQVARILEFLSPGGPDVVQPWTSQDVPEQPVGGALALAQQLRGLPGLRPEHYARLAPHIAALPGDRKLNINTVSLEVLSAFLPAANPALIDQLRRDRATRPFRSVDEIEDRLIETIGEGALEGIDLTRFDIGSSWFEVTTTARLGDRSAQRTTAIQRLAPDVLVAWRFDTWP